MCVFMYEGMHMPWHSSGGQKITLGVGHLPPCLRHSYLSCVTCSTVAGLRVSGGLSPVAAFLLVVGVLGIWTPWLLHRIEVIRLAQQASSSLHSKRGACHYVMIRFFMSLETNEPFRNNINKKIDSVATGCHQFLKEDTSSSLWRLIVIGKNWTRFLPSVYKLQFRIIMSHWLVKKNSLLQKNPNY